MDISALLGQFRQASFRGVPFAVKGASGSQGRRIVIHEYPNRDTIWPEDLGRKRRTFRIQGFVCGPSCYVQRDLLEAAIEQEGYGTLIHPTLGIRHVAVLDHAWEEPDQTMGYIAFSFEFVEYNNALVTIVSDAADLSGISDLFSEASTGFFTDALNYGAPIIATAAALSSGWASQALGLLNSSVAVISSTNSLNGNYGRYNVPDPLNTQSAEGMLSNFAQSRESFSNLVNNAVQARNAPELVSFINAIPQFMATTITDPSTRIRQLTPLAKFEAPTINQPVGYDEDVNTIQQNTASLCRHAALAGIINAVAAWQPTSWDEAQQQNINLATLFNRELFDASANGAGDLYMILRQTKGAVSQAIENKSVNIAHLQDIDRNSPTNALLLAQQIYANGARSVDLIKRADPVHPSFMPMHFQALSS